MYQLEPLPLNYVNSRWEVNESKEFLSVPESLVHYFSWAFIILLHTKQLKLT